MNIHQESGKSAANRASKPRWSNDEDLTSKNMESKIPYTLKDFRHSNHKRLQIVDEVFLISPNGNLSIRKELLCEKAYRHGPMGVCPATYFEYESSSIFKGGLLEVKAFIGLSYGPLGKRVRFDVLYNGNVIGDYRLIHSYMGGGAKGNWPILIEKEWTLLFELDVNPEMNSDTYFRIEYFENLNPTY